jgi:hypothetical protein
MKEFLLIFVLASALCAQTIDTFFVRQTGGNDANTGKTFALGWATIQHAADSADTGDLVLICSDGIYAPTATVDFDTRFGQVTRPVTFRGAGATGTNDSTVATITGIGLPTNGDLINLNLVGMAVRFEFLNIKKGKQHNISISGAVNYANIAFESCTIDSATLYNIYNQESASFPLTINHCRFNGGVRGISGSSATRPACSSISNSIVSNFTGYGIYTGGATEFDFSATGCIFFNNADDDIRFAAVSSGRIININRCTFYEGDSNAIDVPNTQYQIKVENNIFMNKGTAIKTNLGTNSQFAICDYNNYYGNTANIDINSGVAPGNHNAAADPQFVSVVAGSEDFTPQNAAVIGKASKAYGY